MLFISSVFGPFQDCSGVRSRGVGVPVGVGNRIINVLAGWDVMCWLRDYWSLAEMRGVV